MIPICATDYALFTSATNFRLPATAADQAARYVSLAFALGPPPLFEAPPRSEDLPSSLLEVLDFAPLVKEFYRRANIEENLPSYTRAYQAEGDRLRKPTAEMVREVLSYLHTRPITVSAERVLVKPATTPKKNAPKTYTTREHARHFYIVTDLLAAPGAINFRVIGDEYYVVLPEGTDPASSELRRGYLQYIVDPLVLRFNREIAARRDQIKLIIAEREKQALLSALMFSWRFRARWWRRLMRAMKKREDSKALIAKLTPNLLSRRTRRHVRRLRRSFRPARRRSRMKQLRGLADDYERGAILAFFFADQLKGIESSGFDVASFFADMIASFDPAREGRRLTEKCGSSPARAGRPASAPLRQAG